MDATVEYCGLALVAVTALLVGLVVWLIRHGISPADVALIIRSLRGK